MPYYRCPSCRLTVYSSVGYATRRECPNCGRDLADALRVLVNQTKHHGLRRHMVREAQAAAAARRELEALLGELDREELDVTAPLTTELIANSVKHAGPGAGALFELDVSVTSDVVRVAVRDGGVGFTPAKPEQRPDPAAGHWGLRLVDQLADRWGVESGSGTVVSFELDRSPRVAAGRQLSP